jgi:hypothetical protein
VNDLNTIESRALRLEGSLKALAQMAAGTGEAKAEVHVVAEDMASLFDLIAAETHEIVTQVSRAMRSRHMAA